MPQKLDSDAHNLMPDSLAATLPPIYATENESDPVAAVKWFAPGTSWSWYVLEYDPQEQLCFGLVEGHETELGYFGLMEIENIRGPMGLPVERDLHWSPKPRADLLRPGSNPIHAAPARSAVGVGPRLLADAAVGILPQNS